MWVLQGEIVLFYRSLTPIVVLMQFRSASSGYSHSRTQAEEEVIQTNHKIPSASAASPPVTFYL